MPQKVLFSLGNEVLDKFFLSYIGTKFLKDDVNKSKFLSMVIQGQFYNNSVILTDSEGAPYTMNDLYELSIKTIKKSFLDILNLEDDKSFFNKVNDLIGVLKLSNSNKKEITSNILLGNSKSISDETIYKNISKTDFDNLLDTIIMKDYQLDNGNLMNTCSEKKEYWIDDLFLELKERYTKIKNTLLYYKVLSKFLIQEIKNLGFFDKYKFTKDFDEEEKIFSLEFYKELFTDIEKKYKGKEIKDLNIDKYVLIYDEVMAKASELTKSVMNEKIQELIYENNKLDFSTYNKHYYFYILIKNDLTDIIKFVFSVDPSLSLKSMYNTNYYNKEFYSLYSFKNALNKFNDIEELKEVNYTKPIRVYKK